MSNGYGIDVYGKSFYGYSQPADYSVSPFTALQTDYNEITLSWGSPNITSWKLMHLVRSVYGYPATAIDGVLALEITPQTLLRTYSDVNLTPGTIYYYTMFITLEAPQWDSGTTYNINDQVLYNGLYWTCVQNSNINHTPATGSSFWTPTSYIPTWLPAGYTASLALLNQGYGQMLYDRTPNPYKISTSDTFSNTSADNPALQHYLSLFGFGLDTLKASYDSYLQLNNPDVVSATYLDILGQQLGIRTSYLSTPQQRRQRIKNAAVNYRMKGQTLSVHNLVAELTGWDSDITFGPNMYNSADHSSFVHPNYDTWNANVTYFPNQLIQYNGYNYKNLVQSVGTAQAPTGANSSNTWWQVQNQILDTTINLNPRTGKYSIWSVTAGSSNATLNGVLVGIDSPISTTIHNANALSSSQTNNLFVGDYFLTSVTPYSTPNYSASVNYVINNNVLYTDGYYYRAVKPSGPATPYGAVTPGRDQTFWQPFYFKTTDNPNIVKDGIPITHYEVWDSAATYNLGDRVQYRGIIYEATQSNTNNSPSGFYYSNSNWLFVSPAQKTVVASSYWTRTDTSDSQATRSEIAVLFYDNKGNLINNTAPDYSGYNTGHTGAYGRFVIDYDDLQGTTESSLYTNTIGSPNWTTSLSGAWRSAYGMAYVDPTVGGTTPFIFAYLWASDTTGGRFAATFTTEFKDSAHYVQGILFNYKDDNNFYYATRTHLRQVLSGVDTILATWTYIPGEFRMVIDAFNDIHVYKYARTGDGALSLLGTSIGTGPNTNANSGVKFGFVRKYSATGDL